MASAEQNTLEKARKSVTVVCACIMRRAGQEVLLSLRKAPGVPGLHGKWELPGGKIEFGETPEQAIVREIREELAIEIVPQKLLPYLHTNMWEYPHAFQHVILAGYECTVNADGAPNVAGDARWFHVNDIDFNSTLPGTKEFVSLAANTDWFDRVYIQFECADPFGATPKHFTVVTQPTLFSRYGLIKYWGKLGVSARARTEQFNSQTELDTQLFETAKRRLAEGYRISVLKTRDRRYNVLKEMSELRHSAEHAHRARCSQESVQ